MKPFLRRYRTVVKYAFPFVVIAYTLFICAPCKSRPKAVSKGSSKQLKYTPKRPEACPEAQITPKFIAVRNKGVDIRCKLHQPTKQSCFLAKELYKHRDDLEQCKLNKEFIEMCKITHINLASKFQIGFSCDANACLWNKGQRVIASILDPTEGELKREIRLTDSLELEKELPFIAAKTHANGFNFIFLDCISSDDGLISSRSQLIILPSSIPNLPLPKITKKGKVPLLNINVILLDSLSRAQFHRSLPKTIKFFNELNSKKSGAEVLDFELFQALDGHSLRNYHAFFTGDLVPSNLKPAQKHRYPVGHGKLLKLFTGIGYHTTYMGDLCWHASWGLRSDLGMPSNFAGMMNLVKSNHINNTGLTFTTCKIFKHNGITSPFNGPDNDQICYNGKFQHDYILEYLSQLHSEESEPLLPKHRTPFFSFSTMHLSHDYTGRRIQTLDGSFPQFLQRMSLSKNTLTIVVSDHGNVYTEYTRSTLEGRFEMFHPFLFILVPERVSNFIGQERMENMRANQNRLFTMMYLHHTVKTLALEAEGKASLNKGLFDLVSSDRHCDDLTINVPDFCVCDGWGITKGNDTTQLGIVDFAVGSLNNMIHEQRNEAYITGRMRTLPTNRCQRLVPLSFYDVRERQVGQHLITAFDFTIVPGRGSGQTNDAFHVVVQSLIYPKSNSKNMKVLTFDRISQWGIYQVCVDENVSLKLCVCDITLGRTSKGMDNTSLLAETMRHKMNFMEIRVTTEHMSSLPCLYLIIREYMDSSTVNKHSIYAAGFGILNMCTSSLFKVTLFDRGSNLKYSQQFPKRKVILPFGVTYVGTAMRDLTSKSSRIDATVTYLEEKRFV